ncbi:MAG: hypothetical protein ACSW8B_02035 [bacterium]
MDRIVKWKINKERKKVKKNIRRMQKQTKRLILASTVCFGVGIAVGLNAKKILLHFANRIV